MAKEISHTLRAQRSVTLLRGRLGGLEVALSGRDLKEALAELEARLAEQPSFYRGSIATAAFGETLPSMEDLTRLRDVLAAADIILRTVRGCAAGLGELARAQALEFDQEPGRLSDSARSLIADFAGARSDIAQRRKRGETSVRRAKFEPERQRAAELRLVDAAPGTLYHAATLRGGQALHHAGNIVVVGDVNPGAELIAGGDIVVFGRLAGIAHAGAQGDDRARIYALDLAATQLRIAALIAADEGITRSGASGAQAAVAREGKIVVLALDSLGRFERDASSA